MDREIFERFDLFLEAIRQVGIEKVVQRTVREIRPTSHSDSSVSVGPVYFAEYVGYRYGKVFYCKVSGEDISGCRRYLAEYSIEISDVSGNITWMNVGNSAKGVLPGIQ